MPNTTYFAAMRKPTYNVNDVITRRTVAPTTSSIERCPKCDAYDPNMIAALYEYVKFIPVPNAYDVKFIRKTVRTRLCGICRAELRIINKSSGAVRYTSN